MILSFFLFISLTSLGQSFFLSKHAFEESACNTLKPRSGTEQLTSAPYLIELSSTEYQPEKSIRVTIKGIRPTDKFKGFFIVARRDGYTDPYGTWQGSSLVKLIECKIKNDALTHSDLTDRDSISFVWNPPSSYVGSLRIHATVMKDKNTYWLNLKSGAINWFRDSPPTRAPSQSQDHFQQGQHSAGLGQQAAAGESLVKVFDDSSCTTLMTSFRGKPQTSDPSITITTDNQVYQHSKKIKVTIDLKSNSQPFRGYMLQAHSDNFEDLAPIGSFTIENALNNAQLKTCEAQDDTVVHKTWTITRKVEVYWSPPAHYTKKFKFLVTVVQDFHTYWIKVASNMIYFDRQSITHDRIKDIGEDDIFKTGDYRAGIDIVDEGTCTAPCKRKYPIGTGRGVADLLLSVKLTLQKVEQMLQSKCAGPSDCGDVQALGFTKSEVYSITQKGYPTPKDVFCDLENDDGGWLLIFRAMGEVDKNYFDRNWEDYKNGFGDLRGSFFLGNDLISSITQSGQYEIIVKIEMPNGEIKHAHYSSFKIEDESSKYRYHIGAYDGNAGDAYGQLNLQVFSTKDKDHSGRNCAKIHKRGFWFNTDSCYRHIAMPQVESSLTSEIKIRPVNFIPNQKQSQSSSTPVDCAEVQNRGFTQSMVYKIQVTKTSDPIDVYCDLTTEGGGWTVIERKSKRSSTSLNFDRNWNDFKIGFGNVEGEHRLGNEQLSQLTIQRSYQIRYDTKDSKGKLLKYAQFNHFSIASEVLKYRITLQGFTGTDTILQSLLQTNNMPFSSKDRDNDGSNENCAQKYQTGAWFIQHDCLPKDLQQHIVLDRRSPSSNLNQQSSSNQQQSGNLQQQPGNLEQQSGNLQQQSSSQYQQAGSQYQQSSSQYQQSGSGIQYQHQFSSYQTSQQNSEEPSRLENVKRYKHIDLKTRPVNFKEKLQELKYGASKKTISSALPKNCAEVQYKGNENSGAYNIQLQSTTVEVYCDLVTDGGGWLVFHRMWSEKSPDLSKTWLEYKRGFGNKDGNFFLGLDKLHELTKQDPSELRFDIEFPDGEQKYNFHSQFAVGDEASLYQLTIGPKSGTLTRDILGDKNGQPFSTKDRDNDGTPGNCALLKGSGGWFGPKQCVQESSRIDKLTEDHAESSSKTNSWIWKDAVKVESKIRLVTYKSKKCCEV